MADSSVVSPELLGGEQIEWLGTFYRTTRHTIKRFLVVDFNPDLAADANWSNLQHGAYFRSVVSSDVATGVFEGFQILAPLPQVALSIECQCLKRWAPPFW